MLFKFAPHCCPFHLSWLVISCPREHHPPQGPYSPAPHQIPQDSRVTNHSALEPQGLPKLPRRSSRQRDSSWHLDHVNGTPGSCSPGRLSESLLLMNPHGLQGPAQGTPAAQRSWLQSGVARPVLTDTKLNNRETPATAPCFPGALPPLTPCPVSVVSHETSQLRWLPRLM